jgi:uncharacterized protein YfaT (DUF1175 family)
LGIGIVLHTRQSRGIQLEPTSLTLPADGREHRAFSLHPYGLGPLLTSDVAVSSDRIRLVTDGEGRFSGVILAPVSPSQETIRIKVAGKTASLRVTWTLDPTDSFGDGTPDFLRLHTGVDREAFRAWFTAMAEGRADDAPDRVPQEINDCAALLRYAYVEALRTHDDRWMVDSHWGERRAPPSVRQYRYPFTALGAGLFRVTPGPFEAADLSNGNFAQFADAKTLMFRNSYLVSRDIHNARKGDLLFYRQLEQNSPYHSMIVSGDQADWVIYHTGPIGKAKGEIRRVLMTDLLHHPDASWRPLKQNSNFLGVFRWNILREGD